VGGGRKLVCPLHAPLSQSIETLLPDSKNSRLMNRDAMLAVIAARRAVKDATIEIGRDYAADMAGVFAATGMAGIALEEVSRMVANSVNAEREGGGFDLRSFGAVALRQVRPVLSFKILSNMPACFVAISERFQGVNGVYSPWEGHGAQALISGIRAIEHGSAACVLAGGCDVKTHLLGLVSLEQHGALASWHQVGRGTVPAEGACFLILEEQERAQRRGARIYARIAAHAMGTVNGHDSRQLAAVLGRLGTPDYDALVAAQDDDVHWANAERDALRLAGVALPGEALCPKRHMGNLFAAAAPLQVALAAALAAKRGRVLANCFGHGSQQAVFVLETNGGQAHRLNTGGGR